MPAALEAVVVGPGATCSIPQGERLVLPSNRDVRLGRTPAHSITITSRGQGGRTNCTVRPYGNGHALLHAGHSEPITINGRPWMDRRPRPLCDGDVIEPGGDLQLRYVVVDRPLFPVPVDRIGDWLCFLGADLLWRAVPRATPDASPLAVRFVHGEGHIDDVDIDQLIEAGSVDDDAAPRMRAVVNEGGRTAVLYDDVAGVDLASLLRLSRAQGATFDRSIGCAILEPVLRCLLVGETLPSTSATAMASSVVVGFAGTVRCRHFIDARAENLSTTSLELAELVVDVLGADGPGGLPGPEVHDQHGVVVDAVEREARRERRARDRAWSIPELGPLLAEMLAGNDDVAPLLLLRGVSRIAATLPPVTAQTLADLVRGLCPDVVSAEEAVRDELAVLSADLIAALLER